MGAPLASLSRKPPPSSASCPFSIQEAVRRAMLASSGELLLLRGGRVAAQLVACPPDPTPRRVVGNVGLGGRTGLPGWSWCGVQTWLCRGRQPHSAWWRGGRVTFSVARLYLGFDGCNFVQAEWVLSASAQWMKNKSFNFSVSIIFSRCALQHRFLGKEILLKVRPFTKQVICSARIAAKSDKPPLNVQLSSQSLL